MALSDFIEDRRDIKRRGAVIFTVRGLNIEDLTEIVKKMLPDVVEAFGLYVEHKGAGGGLATFDRLVLKLATASPALVAEVISVAADEPEFADKARKLPLPIQIMALTEIVNLTFEEVGSLKNLYATVSQELAASVDPNVLLSLRSQVMQMMSRPSTGGAAAT